MTRNVGKIEFYVLKVLFYNSYEIWSPLVLHVKLIQASLHENIIFVT